MIHIEQEVLQLINIYAPTNPSDRKIFCNNLQNLIKHDKKTIMAGDFNMIENLYLDGLGRNPKITLIIGIQTLKIIKNKHNLIDIWRKNNPFQNNFTYHNADNTSHSRLDRVYTTKTIKTIKCQIIPTTISDHDSISAYFQVNKKEPKGPGIWKLNTTILTQKNFQKIYKHFWNNWQDEKTNYKNHNEWLEIGKLYFKTIAIEYCTKINKEINEKYNNLIKNINEEKLKFQQDSRKIKQYQTELEEIENYKSHGTIIRSKEKIILN